MYTLASNNINILSLNIISIDYVDIYIPQTHYCTKILNICLA